MTQEKLNRILMVMTSHDRKGDTGQPTGAYVPEVAHPFAEFTRAGFVVEFASPKGGRIPFDGTDAKDADSVAFMNDGELQARVHASLKSSEVDPSRYAAIFFAGGHGTMWDFRDDLHFQKVTAAIYAQGGVVAAVCHGPAALVDVIQKDGTPLVMGKEVSAFTNEEESAVGLEHVVPFLLEDALVARGARFSAAPKWAAHVIVSERLVTGQNPASATGVARAAVETLRARL